MKIWIIAITKIYKCTFKKISGFKKWRHYKNYQRKKLDMKMDDTKGLYNVCKYYWKNSKKQLKFQLELL